MSSFQGVRIERFPYRGVLISRGWNRGAPLYTEGNGEIPLYTEGVLISGQEWRDSTVYRRCSHFRRLEDGLHCIQKCPHFSGLEERLHCMIRYLNTLKVP